MSRSHWGGLAGGLAVASLACSRTPPEPPPPATTSGPLVAEAIDAGRAHSSRCISPMPPSVSPIPPVASVEACPKDPEGIPASQAAEITFEEAPGSPKIDVELALTEHQITRGLMYRRSMPESHGMLFRLGERREHTFWMHNTCLPLDMLFVDDDGTIVGIVEAATPLTDTTRTVGCPSLFVVEVNAGWSRRHGVRPGQKVSIPANAR